MEAHLAPNRLTPLVLTGAVIALDRVSKLLVTARIPASSYPSAVRVPLLDSVFSLVRINDPAFAFGLILSRKAFLLVVIGTIVAAIVTLAPRIGQ